MPIVPDDLDPGFWQKIQEVFAAAVELPERDRETYLDSACGGDATVRSEVESLLNAHGSGAAELDESPIRLEESDVKPSSIEIPGYEILEEINRGGQGIVYRALQISTKREVALKVLLRGPLANPAQKRRFEREVELVARLRHPGIVPVFDSGEAHGQSFYAMEFVRGCNLNEFARGDSKNHDEKLKLFVQICAAIGHAHQQGVIHRDIKPSNVLIDESGRPSVVDFGLAKLGPGEASELETEHAISLTGQIMGTLSYMSPEQASGNQDEVDTRSDVYSLGVMLYEFLWGEMPYQLQGPLHKKITTIQHAELVPPSRGKPNSELVTIIRKAMAKEKSRRYATAGSLGDDIDRYLKGYPIAAKRDSAMYVLGKTMRRHRIAVTVAASFLLLIVASGCVAWWLFLSADQAWRQEKVTSDQLRETSEKHLEASTNYRLASEKYQRERDTADRLREESLQKLYNTRMILAGQAANLPGGNQVVADLTAQWIPASEEKDRRDWEWFYLASQCNREMHVATRQIRGISKARWSHDGTRLAVGSSQTVLMFDANVTNKPFICPKHGAVSALAWTPDDRFLASGSTDKSIHIWNTANNQLRLKFTLPLDGRIDGLSWNADGSQLAATNHSGSLRIWQVKDKKLVYELDGLQSPKVEWQPHGEILAISDGGTVRVIKQTGETLGSFQASKYEIRALGWNGYGSRIATVSGEGTTVVWHVERGEELWRHEGGGELEDLAWVPSNDNMLATASRDRSVRIFQAQKGYVIREIKGHGGAVRSVDWHPDGDRLVTTNRDNIVRIWPASNQELSHAIRYYSRFETKRIECRPDGQLFACVGLGPKVKFIRIDNEEISHVLHPGHCEAIAWKPGEPVLATASTEGTVRLWNEDANEPILIFDGHRNSSGATRVASVDWSPDGKHIVSSDWRKKAIVWSSETGEILNEFEEHHIRLEVARWHPKRPLIISASSIGRILIWDAMTGEVHREIPADLQACFDIQWDGKGDRFAAASLNSLAKIWRLDQDEPLFVLKGHSGPVRCVKWHPAGTRIATSSDDGTVKIWSTESGEEVLTIKVSDEPVYGIDWSRNGEQLYSASEDGIIRAWDASYAYKKQRLGGDAATRSSH